MINRRRGRAVYQQIADLLRDEITSGERPEGSALPSADLIRRTYDVSMTTAERVLGLLAAEGLIDTQTGRAARVRPLRVRETLWITPGMTVVTRMPTSTELRDEDLGLTAGVPLFVVQRVGRPDQIYPGDRWQLGVPRPPITRKAVAEADMLE